MGLSPVYIIGMDHFIDYSQTNKVGGRYSNKESDLNHFDPNYFSGKIQYRHQNLKRVELGYALARDYYETHGRELYNASSVTKLDENIIPRVNFEDII